MESVIPDADTGVKLSKLRSIIDSHITSSFNKARKNPSNC